MGIENYEQLQHCSITLNQTALAWQGNVLSADFGGGFEVAAVTVPYGLKRWTLQANVLPDSDDYLFSYSVDDEDFTKSRMRYFFEFFQRHTLFGNKPFIIRDADTNKKFLVSFAEPQVNFDRIGYKLFSGGVTVKERRVSDLVFADDGSIFDDNPPAVTVFTATRLSDTVIRLTMAAIDVDTVTNYEVEFSLTGANPNAAPGTGGWTEISAIDTPIATYDHTGRTGNTRYYYRFRVKDNDENYSAWAYDDDITLPTPDTTPPAMTYFDAQAQTDITVIKIFFAASDNQTVAANLKYDLQWSLNGTSGWTNLLTKQVATTPVTHSGRTPSTEYFYRMRVWDEADNVSGWSTDSATTLTDTTTPTITSFTATGGSGQISLAATFSDDIAVTGVDLQWGVDAIGSTGWFNLLSNAAPTTATTLAYSHTGLPDDAVRYYRLRVRDAANNTTAFATANATTTGGGSADGADWGDGNPVLWQGGAEMEFE